MVGLYYYPKYYYRDQLDCLVLLFYFAQADEEGRDGTDVTSSSWRKDEEYTKDGTVDFRGRQAVKARTGGWRTSWFIYCKFGENGDLGLVVRASVINILFLKIDKYKKCETNP